MKIIYNRTILCLFGFTQKNHSGPIISAMYVFTWHQRCIANIHAAFQCWSFQLGPYGAIGNVSDCNVNYIGSNPGWDRNFYNN